MGEIFPFYHSWSLWDPKASDICFCAGCHFVTLLPPSFTSRLFCLFCFFPLSSSTRMRLFDRGRQRGTAEHDWSIWLLQWTGSPHCLGHQGNFPVTRFRKYCIKCLPNLTSGKLPGSPWSWPAADFVRRSGFSAAVSTAAAPSTWPAAAVWPGDWLLTVLHFSNWAEVASCICYYLEFYSLLANLISPIPCCRDFYISIFSMYCVPVLCFSVISPFWRRDMDK